MRSRAVSIRAVSAALLSLAVIASGCTPSLTPAVAPVVTTIAPSATPAAAPLPTRLPAATATAPAATTPSSTAPAPGTATAVPWQEVASTRFALRLPPGWATLDFDASDAQAAFTRFEKENPELAKALGGPEALEGVELWAFAPQDDPSFTDNLNIRRAPLEGRPVERMTDVMAALEEQYAKFSFEITASDANRTIDGLPAAYLRYDYELAGSAGEKLTVTGHQYLIASPDDLWILSFSAGPASPAESEQVFQEISESFTVVEAH